MSNYAIACAMWLKKTSKLVNFDEFEVVGYLAPFTRLCLKQLKMIDTSSLLQAIYILMILAVIILHMR